MVGTSNQSDPEDLPWFFHDLQLASLGVPERATLKKRRKFPPGDFATIPQYGMNSWGVYEKWGRETLEISSDFQALLSLSKTV